MEDEWIKNKILRYDTDGTQDRRPVRGHVLGADEVWGDQVCRFGCSADSGDPTGATTATTAKGSGPPASIYAKDQQDDSPVAAGRLTTTTTTTTADTAPGGFGSAYANGQQIATNGQRIATNGQQIAANGRQIATNANGQQIATNGQQIATNGQRIATNGQQIATNGQQIATNGQQIATNGQRIATNGQRIAANGQRIATNGQQIAANGRQIATNGQQIATNGRQIATNGQQIATNANGRQIVSIKVLYVTDGVLYMPAVVSEAAWLRLRDQEGWLCPAELVGSSVILRKYQLQFRMAVEWRRCEFVLEVEELTTTLPRSPDKRWTSALSYSSLGCIRVQMSVAWRRLAVQDERCVSLRRQQEEQEREERDRLLRRRTEIIRMLMGGGGGGGGGGSGEITDDCWPMLSARSSSSSSTQGSPAASASASTSASARSTSAAPFATGWDRDRVLDRRNGVAPFQVPGWCLGPTGGDGSPSTPGSEGPSSTPPPSSGSSVSMLGPGEPGKRRRVELPGDLRFDWSNLVDPWEADSAPSFSSSDEEDGEGMEEQQKEEGMEEVQQIVHNL